MKIINYNFYFFIFLTIANNLNFSICSLIAKLFNVVKNQKNKFKPYEERDPKIESKSLSSYEKRQLYWYYKDFVARKEVHKIWDFNEQNITDDEIFSAKSFLPMGVNSLEFGKVIYTDKNYVTPIVYKNSNIFKRSNIIYQNGEKILLLDDFVTVKTIDQLKENKSNTKQAKKLNFFLNNVIENYIWGAIVSPCDGEIQFNLLLEESFDYTQNISLYIIYCDHGGIKERYSHYPGKVVELLNGKVNILHSENKKVDLNKRFSISRGDLILRILEYYSPPLYIEKLVTVPIFMPCEGSIAWEKKHRQIFVKGERIIGFFCKDNEKMKMNQLISPSRGFTEPFGESDANFTEIIKFDDTQKYNNKVIPVGYPLGLMKLEINLNLNNHDNEFLIEKDILIKMPCSGKLEYPLLKNNFILRDEVSLRIIIINNSDF